MKRASMAVAIGLVVAGCSSAAHDAAPQRSPSATVTQTTPPTPTASPSAPAFSLPGSTCTVAPTPVNSADLPALSSPSASLPAPADLSKFLPPDLVALTAREHTDFNLPYLLRNLTISPERDYPYLVNAGFVGGYEAESTANPNGAFINFMQARDHQGALALQDFYARLDNPDAVCASLFTVVGGPPGAIGWQADLITPRDHETSVLFVVDDVLFNVGYLGPIDPAHTVLMQWVTAIAKQAGA